MSLLWFGEVGGKYKKKKETRSRSRSSKGGSPAGLGDAGIALAERGHLDLEPLAIAGNGLIHASEHGVRVAELHPSREGSKGPLLAPLVRLSTLLVVAAAASRLAHPLPLAVSSRRLWRRRRDDGDGALENRNGVGVSTESTVYSGGDMEAHGELELGALAASLERPGGTLGELERARGAAALTRHHGVPCLLEEERAQIRVVERVVGVGCWSGRGRGLPWLGARGGRGRRGRRRPAGEWR